MKAAMMKRRFLPLTTYVAAAKSFQSCLTLCNPRDSSPPGSPSLRFSRGEHWSGLPFPPPMKESEKWKWSHSVVSDPQWPHGLQPTRLLRPWDFPGKSTGVGCHCLLLGKKKNVFNIGAKLQCINSTTSQYPELYITILDKNLSYLVYNSRGEKHLESAKLALRLLLLV